MKLMNSNAFREKLVLVVLLLGSLSAQASSWSFSAPHDTVPKNAEEYEWTENKADLPAYPDKEKLVRIKFDRPDARFEFFIDPETLTVGDDDVVRYVLLLRSPSGSENIMFEGIRCGSKDYKTFAFGTRENKFRQLRSPAWKEITKTSNNWFRYDLWKYYFCSMDERLKVITRENILQRLRNPSDLLPNK